MKALEIVLLGIVTLPGCGSGTPKQASKPSSSPSSLQQPTSLTEARRNFKTNLTRRESANEPVPDPPARIFQKIQYNAPVGKLAAYISTDPKDGKKHPAIVWITGGDCNSIGEVWEDSPASNDQTAASFRKAGIAMMFPSLRGGNDNPGFKEGFLGEVDDVLAAAEFLSKQTFVDPSRIYLGGHSTGGTLALLTAECSTRFRAIFAFGPVASVVMYGREFMPFNANSKQEIELRSPVRWLHSIKVPVFVFEGSGGNIFPLKAMAKVSTNPLVHFLEIEGADHFNTLAPTNDLIAAKILLDKGPTSSLSFSKEDLTRIASKVVVEADEN